MTFIRDARNDMKFHNSSERVGFWFIVLAAYIWGFELGESIARGNYECDHYPGLFMFLGIALFAVSADLRKIVKASPLPLDLLRSPNPAIPWRIALIVIVILALIFTFGIAFGTVVGGQIGPPPLVPSISSTP